MKLTTKIVKQIIKRKIATVVLITASVAAFATLGEGGSSKKTRPSHQSLLTPKPTYNYKNFSLKSTYNYRGSNVINPATEHKYIILNTVVNYNKGNTTYVLPMKKKVFLDKVKINPR